MWRMVYRAKPGQTGCSMRWPPPTPKRRQPHAQRVPRDRTAHQMKLA